MNKKGAGGPGDEDELNSTIAGVAAVDRAIAILSTFKSNDGPLSLAEIANRSGLNKSTILRLAQSLINGRLLLRLEDGRYRIGSEALRLGTLYSEGYDLADVLLPVMRQLADSTGESVVFYVREGAQRVCLLRIESDQPIRYHVREGDLMPLELGSCGRVLLAFSGETGEPYRSIRRDLSYTSLGERSPDTAAIAAPVFGAGQELIGSLGVSGPSTRVDAPFAARSTPQLLSASKAATRDLGGDETVFDQPLAAARLRLAKGTAVS